MCLHDYAVYVFMLLLFILFIYIAFILFTYIAFILFYIVPTAVKATPENSVLEFEAKSGRDGAWSVFPL